MESELNINSMPPSSSKALNTLVDIALTMELTRLKKDDHSYSTHQKNKRLGTFVDKPVHLMSQINPTLYSNDPERPISFMSNNTRSLTLYNTINKNSSQVYLAGDYYETPSPKESSSGGTLLKPKTFLDHTYYVNDYSVPMDIPVCDANGKGQSNQVCEDPLDHTYYTIENKKTTTTKTVSVSRDSDQRCTDDTRAKGLNSSFKTNKDKFWSDEHLPSCMEFTGLSTNDDSNPRCFTLPHVVKKKMYTHRGNNNCDVVFTVTNISDGKSDHTYARHEWQNLSDIMNEMLCGTEYNRDDVNSDHYKDHSYGKYSTKPIPIRRDRLMLNRKSSPTLDVEDFTSLNIGCSDHTYGSM